MLSYLQTCSVPVKDPRDEQCEKLNSKKIVGLKLQWTPKNTSGGEYIILTWNTLITN